MNILHILKLSISIIYSITICAEESFAIANYAYVGCYIDNPNQRAASDRILGRSYTVAQCQAACARENYNYFVVQDGNWCACDNSFEDAARYGVGGDCSRIGTGGDSHNSLYIQSPGFSYIGCYQDSPNRAANDRYFGRSYTPYTCNIACTDYEYFVVQDGDWCACENTYSEATQYGQLPSSHCEPNTRTGGDYTNSLYKHVVGTAGYSYKSPRGRWQFVAGSGGGSTITHSIEVGISNYDESSLSSSQTVALSATVTAGMTFTGGSASIALTASQSQTVSKTVVNAVTRTTTETISIECEAGDQGLYQFVTEVTENAPYKDDKAFLISTQRSWCMSGGNMAPKCPFEYCVQPDCQTCTQRLGYSEGFIFDVLNNPNQILYGGALAFIIFAIAMFIVTVFICKKKTNKQVKKVVYEKVEAEEEEILCEDV